MSFFADCVGTKSMFKNLAAVDAICNAIDNETSWDEANSDFKLHFNILRAAQTVGRFEPFTEAERALIAYLENRMAGRKLCDFAWRTLAASDLNFLIAKKTKNIKPLV